MKPTSQPSEPRISSLAWLYVTAPHLEPFWARTCHLLPMQNQYDLDRADTLRLLKDGKQIIDEKSALRLQYAVMPISVIKRLDYLLSLETAGFRLTSFRLRTALYTRNEEVCVSMNEMIERGYLPHSFVAVNPSNVAVMSPAGNLVDVFVPVTELVRNFNKPI